jgi:hypothetical protein
MLIAGCGKPVMQADAPALLTNPGPQTLQELEQTISSALNGAKTTLAADALTKTSVLVIERRRQEGIGRVPEPGRDMGRPYRFQLVIRGAQCLLVDQQSGIQWPLTDVECIRE